MTKVERIEAYLAHCNGFENHYRHPFGRGATYSEGVKFVAETANAYWLIDAVMSHQSAYLDDETDGFQHWTLTLNGKGGADLVATDGGGDDEPRELVRQHIEFTDFPLPSLELYVECGVLMLKEER